MTRLFLSHSSRNSVQAVALLRWLVEQRPALTGNIFLDLDEKSGIAQGVRWRDALRGGLARCEAVICLTSRDWHTSAECVAEYLTAVNLGKRIYCARLEPFTDTDPTREWQRCDLFGDGPVTEIQVDGQLEPVRMRTEGLRRLLDGLGDAGIGAENFPWPPAGEPDRSPYRGWRPFDAVDAAVYFGREVQVMAGLEHLRRMRSIGAESMFVVLGASGTGKSSFLRAGLLPRLAREDRHFLVLDIMRPERRALTGAHGLAAVIYATRTRLGLTTPTLGEIKSALPDVDRAREWLVQMQHAARDRWPSNDVDIPLPTLLLPIDQAEELFVADAGAQGEQFLKLLGTLLAVPDEVGTQHVSIKAAVTIRTDRYEQLQNSVQMKTVPRFVFDALEPLPRTQFKEVITGPAARADDSVALRIEPDLVDRLLADGDHGADTLPLLALTLSRLYDDYAASGTLTVENYNAMGGIDRVVHTEVESLLSTDPRIRQRQLEVLRSAFIPALATVDPDSDQPMRRIARWEELPEEAHELIDGFVDKRLLVKDRRDGEVIVEVALESLLRRWDSLAGWLRAQADDLKAADRLERAVEGWNRNGRDQSWLLEGTRLAEAETLSAKPDYQRRLQPAREFLLASRRREEDRLTALRRRARALAALLVVAVAVAGLAGAGFWRADTAGKRAEAASIRAEARTREAVGRQLVAEAQAMFEQSRSGGDIRAVQQILAAHALAPSPETAGAIVGALYERRQTAKIVDTGSDVWDVVFSPDGRRVVTGGLDLRLRSWDADSGELVGEPRQIPTRTLGVQFKRLSLDGRRAVTSQLGGPLRLWDVESGQPTGQPLNVDIGILGDVAVSPGGRRVVTGDQDGAVRLWDAESGQPIGRPLIGHTNAVDSVAFSPDGRRIVSGSLDRTVRLWDAESGQPIGRPLIGHTDTVDSVAFSPDGRRVISGGSDRTARLWDVESGNSIGRPLTGHADYVSSLAFSPDGRWVVTGDYRGILRLWDVGSGQLIGAPMLGHTNGVMNVAFSPDGRRIVSGSLDGTVRIWDVGRGYLIGQPMIGHSNIVASVAFSPDGKRIASGSSDGTVRLWGVGSGQTLGEPLIGHTQAVKRVVFSPDGRKIVSVSHDGTMRLWDVDAGRPIGEPLTGLGNAVPNAVFTPDGKRVVSGSDKKLLFWDAESGKRIRELPIGDRVGAENAVFSSDGTRVATDWGGTVQLWDVESGRKIEELPDSGSAPVGGMAFSPDGKRFATGGHDGMVRSWDIESARPLGQPTIGHNDIVKSVTFSPDGKRIVSGSRDRTVRLWDTESGQLLGTPMIGHISEVASVAFSPDGTLVASGSWDTTVRVWPAYDADPDKLCAKLTSNMSQRNWSDRVRMPNQPYIELCPGLPISPR
ncbi:nSTAND1 domain-containing NTPase [Nocardia gamkensis]|uniref:TIR domain-containing protein n=1 Tax=Nocardia gamkensis TaxID=352869 RepID=A0A7X6L1G1_9NOCA|nr:TIR domain-containing protein [Nocardia gamkensis]NKY26000.1 TIR domain-containing protein [Nocardia gamkensis]NQE71437.1 putative WD repeat-containing protein [Nocardia gamkensis]